MNVLKRSLIVAICIILLAVPVSVNCFAVDPVSAATMANALAQAITAYGASNGVSMMFDVSSTDGIGEALHDLWGQFKTDINDNNVPTYDSLAVTIWSTLYKKVGDNVAINLSDTTVSYLDAFWNWLLSGPAEMTKVDNQYYEWTLDQNNTIQPIAVYDNAVLGSLKLYSQISARAWNSNYIGNTTNNGYVIWVSSGNNAYPGWISNNSNSVGQWFEDGNLSFSKSLNGPYGDIYYYSGSRYVPLSSVDSSLISGTQSSIQSFIESNTDPIVNNDILVQPYIGDTVPQDVYIPDNEDVNYQPLPYVGPLNLPWDQTRYGDGSGTLSDAQSQAIEGDLSSAIENDRTLELAQDTPIPADTPKPNYLPILPVALPSFNFSLSGIWHYVRDWVSSLGAWFTLVFSLWASLPYAIVVPVYATAVIVVVLGVYKRFFI